MDNSMHDLGKVEDYPHVTSEPKEAENKKYYPKTEFTTEQLPGLENLKVGDKVKMIIEAEVCSVTQGEEYGPEDNKKPVQTRVRVKMMQGMAEPMMKESIKMKSEEPDKGTEAYTKRQKEKSFNKDLGLDTEE